MSITINIDQASLEEILAKITVAEAQNGRMMESAGLPLSGFYVPSTSSRKIDTSGVVETWGIDPGERDQINAMFPPMMSGMELAQSGFSFARGRGTSMMMSRMIGAQNMAALRELQMMQRSLQGLTAGTGDIAGMAMGGVFLGAVLSLLTMIMAEIEKIKTERKQYMEMLQAINPELSKAQFDKWYDRKTDWTRRTTYLVG